jgi:endonuclease-3
VAISTARNDAKATWTHPSRARVLRIRDRLRLVYGIPRMAPHGHPLAELILTVLSQSTNDRNRDVAFLRLRERFASWEAVRDAPVTEVEEAIRPGGISKVKSARIQAILRAISAGGRPDPGGRGPGGRGPGGRDPGGRDPGGRDPHPSHELSLLHELTSSRELSLGWLAHASVQEGRDYLCALPGVGRKTAACVLLFAFGLRDVPVDTHVSRVATRLRLLRPGASFEEQHDALLALTPPGQELELHVNLLRHGRRTCAARAPACGECALARMCPSRGLFAEGGRARATA